MTKGYRAIGEAPAQPWANVPLFKPAVAVLAGAVIAVGALALIDSQQKQSANPALGHSEAEFERLTFRPGLLAMAPGATNGNATAPYDFIDHDGVRRSDALQAEPGQRFVEQKVAIDNRHFRVLSNGIGEKLAEVSFEFPDDMRSVTTSPAVFNPPAAFDDQVSGIGFLPAPTKPRMFDNSVAASAIQLPLPKPARKPNRFGPLASVAALDAHFDRLDYNLADLHKPGNHVPRVYLDKLPDDIAQEQSIKMRKRVFIKSILPVVLHVNEDILAARQNLQQLRDILDSGLSLTEEQRNWLYQMAERYETDPYDWEAFMARVDIVPPSLALAQAAEESGWGTSRFAREGNALFGQYTYKASNGMLPEERANGRHHLIRAYSNLIQGVRSYIHNLNYHRAYKEFRAARKWLRNHDKPIDGHTLAGELIRYSERGAAYVKTLRRIMRANKLFSLDRVRLHDDRWTRGNPAQRDQQS